MNNQLTLFQSFNSMRIFLNLYYDHTHAEDIGMLLGGLRLFKDFDGWQDDPQTWDAPAWRDWMDGVNKTLQDLNITKNPKTIIYDEWTAFLCTQNYLQLFYNQFPFDDVGDVLKLLSTVKQTPNNPVWQAWLKAVDHSIHETYPLDEPLEG